MEIDMVKIKIIKNNILFGLKEIKKVASESTLDINLNIIIDLIYLTKLISDLNKDISELKLIKSYIKE